MPYRRHAFGREAEEYAAKFLQKMGWKILERNYHTRFGEIDLIAVDGTEVVFVEVKARKNDLFGSAIESVTEAKIQKITKTAQLYLLSKQWDDQPYRIDVICVTQKNSLYEVEHFQNIG